MSEDFSGLIRDDDPLRAEVAEWYARGYSTREIADTLGVSHMTIQRWLKAAGEARRNYSTAGLLRWAKKGR